MIVYFEDLAKIYDGKKIFTSIGGKIDKGDRIGLIGANGIGKSTLLRVLLGQEGSEEGLVKVSSGTKVVYVEQEPVFDKDISVYDELANTSLAGAVDYKGLENQCKKALNTLGLTREFWGQKASRLSGGEKTKLLLCKVLLSDFDLLILDEPTNHLDIESIQWLEQYLVQLHRTLLIVSHDRYFLDNVADKIWELTAESLKVYKGNYSDYKAERERQVKNTSKEYQKQQARIEALKKVVNVRKNWFKMAHDSAGQNDFYRAKAKKHASIIKAKEKELERLEDNRIGKPQKPVSPAFDIINKGVKQAKQPPVLVRVENLHKKYGSRDIFKNTSFVINRNDKTALLGANGSGKTTLLKIIAGIDKDWAGEVRVNPSLKTAYFSQELDDLDYEKTVIEETMVTGVGVKEARLLLAGLLFKGNSVKKKISSLSMGEKCRVAFAKLILSGAGLLILDEPTNYLDIPSREKIEEVLGDFQGSLVFVSHDRYFIKKLANKIMKIQELELRVYDGGFDYYLQKMQEETLQEKVGEDYQKINDDIRRLECELAFLSAKLNEPLTEEEKEQLNQKFLETAQKVNKNKALVNEWE